MKTDLTATTFIFKGNKVLLIFHKTLKMWIGVGGHLAENETPDQTVLRKVKNETGLDIKIISKALDIEVTDNTVRNCPIPFHCDVHSVGDHHHYSQYYICEQINPDAEVTTHKESMEKYKWFTKEKVLKEPSIDTKTKSIAVEAFRNFEKLTS
ncbi:MAG: NUDIX domain-containing protein [Patescibacteria group bacterium]